MNVSFSRNHTNKYLRGIISSQVDATIIIRRFSGISVQQLLTKTFLTISRHLRHVFTGTSSTRPLVCAVVADEWTVLGKLASVDVAVLVQRRRITGFWANQRRPAAFQWRLAIPEHRRHTPKCHDSIPAKSLLALLVTTQSADNETSTTDSMQRMRIHLTAMQIWPSCSLHQNSQQNQSAYVYLTLATLVSQWRKLCFAYQSCIHLPVFKVIWKFKEGFWSNFQVLWLSAHLWTILSIPSGRGLRKWQISYPPT